VNAFWKVQWRWEIFSELLITDMQRDLGVEVHRSLKVRSQMEKVVKKAYGMLAFISRGIEFKNWQVMLQLYRNLERPLLEYSVQFWSPHYQKDVEALERVQKIFSRMLPGVEGIGYEERLEKHFCSHWDHGV